MTEKTMTEFAEMVYSLLKSDRDVVVATGGFTGEGKSTFTTKLQKEYQRISKTKWDFSHMTWSRKELLTWIDGEKDSKRGKNGLKKGQMPEFSAILPDELFLMFYSRNWHDTDQIDAIATFNMCRDRHLFVAGNIPNFWELDAGFRSRIRFFVFIAKRGIAWVFEQELNPFGKDAWNVRENMKLFRRFRNPEKLPNYLCTIFFDDWDEEEKKQYYKIRNEKRVLAIDENKKEKVAKYTKIKAQRDEAIRKVFEMNPKLTNVEAAKMFDLSESGIRQIRGESIA